MSFKKQQRHRDNPPGNTRVPNDRKKDEKSIRLNKYIAQSGVCSRREADKLIEGGKIRVNSKVIKEMGYQVAPGDKVYYGSKLLSKEKLVYVLLNKPKDFITTTDDPHERKTVMSLVATACEERIYPVGRLDRNTTGVLLLTNDGELSKKLTHPSHEIGKVYQVELDVPVTNEHLTKIEEGLDLEDGFIKIDDIALLDNSGQNLGVEIHSGKNRIVKRIFESLGYDVIKLDRVMFAGLTKKDLPRGKWRFLKEKEIIRLKYLK
jgi:23S rRNA pseudouridine2605 synthase